MVDTTPRGETRAKESNSNAVKVEERRKEPGVIYIGHLPWGFEEKGLTEYFSQFGTIKNLRLARSRKTGNSKGYAFVKFAHDEVAKIAAESMDNYLMFGKLLKCKHIRDVHPSTFRGKKRVLPHWRFALNQTVERQAKASEAGKTGSHQKVPKAYKKKMKKLKELGIDYTIEELENQINERKAKLNDKTTKSKSENEEAEMITGDDDSDDDLKALNQVGESDSDDDDYDDYDDDDDDNLKTTKGQTSNRKTPVKANQAANKNVKTPKSAKKVETPLTSVKPKIPIVHQTPKSSTKGNPNKGSSVKKQNPRKTKVDESEGQAVNMEFKTPQNKKSSVSRNENMEFKTPQNKKLPANLVTASMSAPGGMKRKHGAEEQNKSGKKSNKKRYFGDLSKEAEDSPIFQKKDKPTKESLDVKSNKNKNTPQKSTENIKAVEELNINTPGALKKEGKHKLMRKQSLGTPRLTDKLKTPPSRGRRKKSL